MLLGCKEVLLLSFLIYVSRLGQASRKWVPGSAFGYLLSQDPALPKGQHLVRLPSPYNLWWASMILPPRKVQCHKPNHWFANSQLLPAVYSSVMWAWEAAPPSVMLETPRRNFGLISSQNFDSSAIDTWPGCQNILGVLWNERIMHFYLPLEGQPCIRHCS